MNTYTFYANASDTVFLRINSGSIRLYAPNGTELTRGAEISYPLPDDGMYVTIVGFYTGSYNMFIQRLNNPVNATPVGFGETVSGSIDFPDEMDTYTFSANAGDTVLIRMNEVSGNLWPEIRLYAPNGTELDRDYDFSNAEISYTLAEDGGYTVLAYEYWGSYTGNYTLSLSVTTPQPLTIGEPYTGNISTDNWHLFFVNAPTGENLLITLEPESPTGTLELYGGYNRVPTESEYDYLTKKKNVFGNYELVISPTENGTYYFGVYGKDVEDIMGYNITASLGDRYVSDIYPRIVTNSTRATVHIYGIGFTNGMQVELRDGNVSIAQAQTVVISSATMIIAHFNLTHVPVSDYDIAVIWPDAYEEVIESAIEVAERQEGALYSFPAIDINEGDTLTYDIQVPDTHNLFITLQKTTLISYGNSWRSELSLMHDGTEITSKSGSHDLMLHIMDPESGSYTVNITASKAGSGILTVWTSLPELPLGEWVVGTIYCSYGSVWYQVEVPPDQDTLYFEAEGMGLWSHFDIYYEEYGCSEHWVSRQGTRVSMEIPDPDPGTYIVEFLDSAMIYGGEDQTRDVLLKADITFSVEPQPDYLPTITSLSIDRGGNTGFVTVEMKGGWLDSNATVSLTRSDYEDIIAQNVYGSANGTTLTATFNLTDKEPEKWNLVVTNPDGRNATAPSLFIIEEGGEPEFWMEIIGREKIRAGREQTYIVRYGNSGTINCVSLLLLNFTKGDAINRIEYEIIYSSPNGTERYSSYFENSYSVVPLIVGASPGNIGTMKITIKSSSPTGGLLSLTSDNEALIELSNTIKIGIDVKGVFDDLQDAYRVGEIVGEALEETIRKAGYEPLEDGIRRIEKAVAEEIYFLLKKCPGGWVFEVFEPLFKKELEESYPDMSDQEIEDIIGDTDDEFIEEISELPSELGEYKVVKVVSSSTPEDKYGPPGFDMPGTPPEGCRRFVSEDQNLYYKIDFWNAENATAPACDVYVNDQLDTNFNWSTFRFEAIGFLNWTVELEPCQYFNVYVDTRPEMDLIVNAEGTFDPETGAINWTFRSLDPDTLETPDDPMTGFLPPITESGYEIGWACFSVDPEPDLPTGTQIKNQAFVNFDGVGPFNPAPKEGPFTNTIDAAPPTSNMTATLLEGNAIQLNLTGEDDLNGSGIRDYTIYVSDNSMSYMSWLVHTINTSAVFVGESGHTYAFYSVARDNAGNIEEVPEEPDATVFCPSGAEIFDTEASINPYPSISGTHNGTITPSCNINVSKLYTYPCEGTGGHTESIELYENDTLIANGTWNGYVGDWHNITVTPSVTLRAGHTYNYTIITGSYPQIIHESSKEVTGGTITCDKFTDANGVVHYDWIPTIMLE